MEHSNADATPRNDSPAPRPDLSQQIVNGLNSGVIALDAADRILTINPAASRHLNIPLEKLEPGRRFDSIEALSPFVDILSEVRENLEPVSRREVYIGREHSKKKEIGVSVSLLEGSENYNGCVFLFTDMTERRKLERAAGARAQLASLGELAAGVVHELRNPLAIISGRAELLLRKSEKTGPSRESVEAILSEVELLTKAIAHFLSFAKPFELNPEACAPRDIFDRAEELCSEHAQENGAVLTFEIDGVVEEMYVDKSRNAEALANIINNAIDAVGPGGRVAARVRQEGAETVFTIDDDGPGIHLKADEDLFSPFFTKRRDGTGLGLAIVNRIVRVQGGTVIHTTPKIGGARFEVRIPTVHGRRD